MNHKSWKDIFSFWDYMFHAHGIPKNDMFSFVNLEVDFLPGTNNNQLYNWWPKEEVSKRKSILVRETLAPQSWETKKGTLKTVHELFSAKGNKERQAAIWVMASLYDKKNNFPPVWDSDSKRIVYEMFNAIKEEFVEIEPWNNATREALPYSLIDDHCEKSITFSSAEQLLYLLVVEAALINGNWQLVNFTGRST